MILDVGSSGRSQIKLRTFYNSVITKRPCSRTRVDFDKLLSCINNADIMNQGIVSTDNMQRMSLGSFNSQIGDSDIIYIYIDAFRRSIVSINDNPGSISG